MNILTIPLKNIRRKMLRSFIILFIFTIGITSVVSLYKVSEIVSISLEEKLNKFGANIVINPKIDTMNISYGGVNLGNIVYDVKYIELSSAIEKIKSIKYANNISAIAPKLIVIKDFQNKKVGLVGVDFEQEVKIKNYWMIDGKIPKVKNQILVGSEVSKKLKLDLHDNLTLDGKEFTVSGILKKVGSEDDFLVFMDIQTLQGLSSLFNKANFIEISALCAGCPIDEIVNELERVLPDHNVNALQKIVRQRMSAIHFVEHLAYIISGIILFASCFIIGLFIFNSVNERKKEIGILRSMGYTRRSIFVIFSFEVLLIAFFSGLLGYNLGIFFGNTVLKYLSIENTSISISGLEMLFVIIAVLFLAVISAFYPSYKASKVEPVETIISL